MAGIIDFEVRFGGSRVTVPEMHEACGVPVADLTAITHCTEIPALDEHEEAWELAYQAAAAVLERTAVPPEAIGQVIYAGSGEWDSAIWSPAAQVADELGITGAHCYELINFCNASVAALRSGVDSILLGRADHVLVLLGDRLTRLLDYTDPDAKSLFNFGDAPAAVLLGREGVDFRVAHTALRTDPSWCGLYTGDREDDRVVVRRRARRSGTADAYVTNLSALVDQTLTALDRDIDDVAHLLINQSNRAMHERLLDTIGLPQERSAFNYDRLGHMGCADPFIALGDLLEAKELEPGDLVLLASSGLGFSWGVAALEYQGG